MSAGKFTEDQLVEQPAIHLFGELGWDTVSVPKKPCHRKVLKSADSRCLCI